MKKSPSLPPQILINIFIVVLAFSWEIKHTIASQLGGVCGSANNTIRYPGGAVVRFCSSATDVTKLTQQEKDLAKDKNLIERAKRQCATQCNITDPCDGNNCICQKDLSTVKVTNSQNITINRCDPVTPHAGECKSGETTFRCTYGTATPIDISCDCTCQINSRNPSPGPRSSQTEECTSCTCGKPPSLVKLSNFIAKPTSNGISLNWTTKTEPDSQGFKMWRAIPKLDKYCGCSGNIDDYTQIQVLDEEGKPVLIPAKGNTTSGSDYSYLDKDAKPGIAYCYALEDVDSKGESKFYFEYVAFTQDSLEESK
jgi:hypothetical protein